MDDSGKVILDLCGGTGSWSRPYKDAGYDVRLVTLPDYDVCTYDPPKNVYGILAAPPCTEFSVLNCKAEARNRKPEIGMVVVTACLRIIAMCNPRWWAMENPVGYLRNYMGKPALTFQPWEYGDPWTKRTDIWGYFTAPKKMYADWKYVPDKLPLYARAAKGKAACGSTSPTSGKGKQSIPIMGNEKGNVKTMLTLHMKLKNETKTCFRFERRDDAGNLVTLYLKKNDGLIYFKRGIVTF